MKVMCMCGNPSGIHCQRYDLFMTYLRDLDRTQHKPDLSDEKNEEKSEIKSEETVLKNDGKSEEKETRHCESIWRSTQYHMIELMNRLKTNELRDILVCHNRIWILLNG